MGRAQLLRELVHLLGEIYSLEVDRYRADLHRTAALGALLGIMTEGQNQKASEHFTGCTRNGMSSGHARKGLDSDSVSAR